MFILESFQLTLLAASGYFLLHSLFNLYRLNKMNKSLMTLGDALKANLKLARRVAELEYMAQIDKGLSDELMETAEAMANRIDVLEEQKQFDTTWIETLTELYKREACEVERLKKDIVIIKLKHKGAK